MQTSGHEAVRPSTKASKFVAATMAVIAAAALIAVYAWVRIDHVQKNIETVNQFYVPTLKHLNLISGKWSAWQRTFEQSVAFRKWGDPKAGITPGPVKLRLKKFVDQNLDELERLGQVHLESEVATADQKKIASWTERLKQHSEQEVEFSAEIAAHVKAKKFMEAAALYTRARQEQLDISSELQNLTLQLETTLSGTQLATEDELRSSQVVVLALLFGSLLFSLTVLVRLRRWFVPVFEWTDVAREIATKGLNADVKFPRVTAGMPDELAVLTSEFSRMARTIQERELTIGHQKDKLQLLNSRLRDQNDRLVAMGELERKLEHARKLALAGNMSSQIAHEVRNPLNSMSLHLEMLRDDVEGMSADEGAKEEVFSRIQAMSDQVERLERITRSYLEVGKQQPSNKDLVDVHTLIERAVQFLGSELQAANVLVQLDLSANKPVVRADADKLSQVLFNLIRNAIDAMAGVTVAKKLRISTSDVTHGHDHDIAIRVNDSGPGVDREIRSKIFEPFVTNKTNGHGLGLSVSRQICIDHGGDLRLTDLAGSGACFEITLPEGSSNGL